MLGITSVRLPENPPVITKDLKIPLGIEVKNGVYRSPAIVLFDYYEVV